MREYNILTPGEKIKSVRKTLDLKQEDITCGEVTRNLVSIIENNKANLTESVAKIIEENINRICKERNIEFTITKEYLLEDIVSQAKKVANEYIEYIRNLSKEEINKIDDTLSEIDIFLKKYDTEEKRGELYFEIAIKFRGNKQYNKAIDYLLKAYESSKSIEFTTDILLNLSSWNIYLARYEDAINYCKVLLDLSSDVKIQFKGRYNLALCYKKINRFEEALDILKDINLKDIIDEHPEKYTKVQLLLGSCLNELKSINKAIEVYKDLLKVVENKKDRICILSNLADVYCNIKDNVNLEKTCNKMLKLIKENPGVLEEYEAYIYLSLARHIRIATNDKDTVIELLIKALEDFKTAKCSLYFEDIEGLISDLLDIFIEDNNEEKVQFLRNELFEIIEKNIFPKVSATALRFIRYYNEKNKKEEINSMINYLAG